MLSCYNTFIKAKEEALCKRDPKSGKVVTGGIVSCQDSGWLMSWTINRQGQFKEQDNLYYSILHAQSKGRPS